MLRMNVYIEPARKVGTSMQHKGDRNHTLLVRRLSKLTLTSLLAEQSLHTGFNFTQRHAFEHAALFFQFHFKR